MAVNNSPPVNILLVEDSPSDTGLILKMLKDSDFQVFNPLCAGSLDVGLSRLNSEKIDIIITDLNLPDSTGIDTFRRLHEHSTDLPIVVLTGSSVSEEIGIQTVREGAQDYITKDNINSIMLSRSIRYAIEHKKNEVFRRKSHEYANSIIDTIPTPLIVLDDELKVVSASWSFYNYFRIKPEDTETKLFNELGEGEWDIPKLCDMLSDLITGKSSTEKCTVKRDFPNIGNRIMSLNGRLIKRDSISPHYILLTIEDITNRKTAEKALRESEEKLRVRNGNMEYALKQAQSVHEKFIPSKGFSHRHIVSEFRYMPFDKVGGDYFSFADMENGGVSVFLGDVMGHGISAALFLSLLKSASERVFKSHGLEPQDYLSVLNMELIEYMDLNYLTALYGLFEFGDGGASPVFRFSSGGHPGPILLRSSTGETELLQARGTVLGTFKNLTFSENCAALEKGDRIFIYTDGIPEATNSLREVIGFDELQNVIRRVNGPGLGDTLDAIIDEMHCFCGATPIEDDVTIIGFEIL